MVVCAGNGSASSAKLELPETRVSDGFRVKNSDFSSFWRFFTKSADAERVLRPVTMVVDTVDTVGG